jgi:hypothetical protein
LCRPDKGDVGEVLTALYFLFCCDECGPNIVDDNPDYRTFSVPLADWIDSLMKKECSSQIDDKPIAPAIRVNFIQICRDYMRSPWIGLADQVFLENLYTAGTAFYTYPGRDLIDLVIPTVFTKEGNTKSYSSVLVSIKSRSYFSPGEAEAVCDKMKTKANKLKLKNVLCIVCVFGQTSEPDYKEYTYDASKMLTKLQGGENVAFVLCFPLKDRFGLTDIFLEMTTTTEKSELLSSHSFLRARSKEFTSDNALRSSGGTTIRKAVKDFQNFMKDLATEK